MKHARETFRAVLNRPSCTTAAPIFDPLSARIAEMQGWELCKLSGSVGKFANLAVPDGLPLSNMSDLVDTVWRIRRAANICLVVDADDCGGNAINVLRTVRELEAAGAAAIEIEDNLVPRRFGEAQSRHALMLTVEEQVNKLRAAVAARRDSATAVVARTSALAELPHDEALERIRAYSGTGAEAIMLPDWKGGVQALHDIRRVSHLPLLVLRLPEELARDATRLETLKIRVRFLPQLPFRMAVKAISDALNVLKGESPGVAPEREADAAFLRKLDRTYEMEQWQERFFTSQSTEDAEKKPDR